MRLNAMKITISILFHFTNKNENKWNVWKTFKRKTSVIFFTQILGVITAI